MKLRHKTPCNQCPWRKNSAPGYLGGNAPEVYADAVQRNTVPACHQRDHGWDNPRSAMCAGALAVMQNSCIEPRYNGTWGDADKVGKRDDCFKWVRDFYRYHAGKEYVHPLMRRIT